MNTRRQKPVGSACMPLLILVVALMFPEIPNALAQADDYTKFGLSLGIFVTDRDSKTRFDVQADVSLSDSQDNEPSQRQSFGLQYRRLWPHHWLTGGFLTLERNDELGLDLRTS